MRLRLIREPSAQQTTLGVLFVNGRYLAFSLEDEIREQPGVPVAQWKVPGRTAIPAGRYRVRLSWSPRFQRVLPEVLAVPGFDGIRLHPGNRHADTEGCILLGVQRAGAAIVSSRPAHAALEAQLEQAAAANEDVWLTIENPEVP